MPPRSRAAAGAASFPPVPAKCVVTGGSGFVGQRLVEMLVERGAQRVVSFDIAPTPRDALQDARVVYQQGNLTKLDDVLKACEVRVWRQQQLRGNANASRACRARTACGTSPRLWARIMSTRRTTTSTTRASPRDDWPPTVCAAVRVVRARRALEAARSRGRRAAREPLPHVPHAGTRCTRCAAALVPVWGTCTAGLKADVFRCPAPPPRCGAGAR